jgi:uncharacterized membrane protein
MTTPILMLALMTMPYLVIRLLSVIMHRHYNAQRAAAIGLALLFLFTGIGHFIDTESMAQMLPPWVPERAYLVRMTGVLEFAVAAGFLSKTYRRFTGCVAAIMLILFFPVNVYAALNYIPMGGHAWGPIYLFVRTPLQVIMFLWIYHFAIKHPDHSDRKEAAPVFRKRDRLPEVTGAGAGRYRF